jgi:hypothetical protein
VVVGALVVVPVYTTVRVATTGLPETDVLRSVWVTVMGLHPPLSAPSAADAFILLSKAVLAT